MDKIIELLTHIVTMIVDDTENIKITEEPADGSTLIKITVSKKDTGRLIGRGGRVASSIRTVILSAGRKQNIKLQVSVLNPSDEEPGSQ